MLEADLLKRITINTNDLTRLNHEELDQLEKNLREAHGPPRRTTTPPLRLMMRVRTAGCQTH